MRRFILALLCSSFPALAFGQIIVGMDGRRLPPITDMPPGYVGTWEPWDEAIRGKALRDGDPNLRVWDAWNGAGAVSQELEDLIASKYRPAERAGLFDDLFQLGDAPGEKLAELKRRLVEQIAHGDSFGFRLILASIELGGPVFGEYLDAREWIHSKAKDGDASARSAACRESLRPDHMDGLLFRWCLTLSEQGDGDASYRVGLVQLGEKSDFHSNVLRQFHSVLGVRPTHLGAVRAAPLFQKAAMVGHAGAQARLASLLATGRAGRRDDRAARELAEAASFQGNLEGRALLALMLMQGRGGATDVKRALPLLTQAARGGERLAQLTLAALHFRGQHVPRDIPAGLTWVNLADFTPRPLPAPHHLGDLPLELPQRTMVVAETARTPALDAETRARAALLRKELAESGEWPWGEEFARMAKALE